MKIEIIKNIERERREREREKEKYVIMK